jgi:hypothetical protein
LALGRWPSTRKASWSPSSRTLTTPSGPRRRWRKSGSPSAICGVYTSQQTLEDHERFLAQRTLARRVVGGLTDDPDTIKLYFGYARDGGSALWVHVPDDADAKRAVRCLADHQVLHIRYYAHGRQDDLHIR